MIIGVTGKKNAGKDTVGDYLVEHYGFTKLSFAEKGKIVICETFGISREDLEDFKNDPLIQIFVKDWSQENDLVPGRQGKTLRDMTFREFIQRLLNEGMKSAYGQLFHVEQLLPINFQHAGFKYVICDTRFPFEAMRIKELGGRVIEVQRSGLIAPDPHVSEAGIPGELIDYTVANDLAIVDLHHEVEKVLDKWLEQIH